MQTTIAERILQARKNKGLTQNQVAEAIFVTPQAVSLWERGESMPDTDKLSSIAALLEVSVDWLLDGKNVDGIIKEATKEMSDRLFDESKMYTYLKGAFASQGLYQSLRLLPYVKEKHRGQHRGGVEKVPYFSHPLQLASHAWALGYNEDSLISACLLHDVCEDCGVYLDDLPADDETKEAVGLLTKSGFPKKPENPTEEEKRLYKEKKAAAELKYYQAISKNRIATIVKLLDRCHNLSSMACVWPPEKLAEYIIETEKYIYPLMENAKNVYTHDYAKIYLIKYHMRSVVETVRHLLPA